VPPADKSSADAAARTRVRWGSLALPAAAIAALAGCGGSSETVTKSSYIAKVNAICTTEQAELRQLALSKTKLGAKVDEANHIREADLAKIEAVKTPGSEAISPEWLSDRKRAGEAARKVSLAGFGSRAARAPSAEFVVLSNEARKLALAYGLSACRGFAAT
jgi:hypothetical protein